MNKGSITMIRQLLTTTLAAGFLLAGTGCLVVSGDAIEERGVKVTGATLDQIEVGVTTEDWLLAALGEPSDITEVASHEGVRIFKYTHEVRESEGGAVFLIYAGGSTDIQQSVAYFEITNGVVTRYWVE